MATLKNDVITWRYLFNIVTAFKTVYSFIVSILSVHFVLGIFFYPFLANYLQTYNLLLKRVFFSIQTYSVTHLLYLV